MSHSASEYDEVRVRLAKVAPESPVGIVLADALKGDGPQHPFVYGMQPGTLASGQVEDGDRVQMVNGTETRKARAAAKLISKAAQEVELVLLRPSDLQRAIELSSAEFRAEEFEVQTAVCSSLALTHSETHHQQGESSAAGLALGEPLPPTAPCDETEQGIRIANRRNLNGKARMLDGGVSVSYDHEHD